MAEVNEEQQLKEKEAADLAERFKALETELQDTKGKLSEVTTESIKRKEQLRELKEGEEQRKQQEQEAQDKAEQERLAELPDNQRQAEETKSLLGEFRTLIDNVNSNVEGLRSEVQSSTKQSVERQKAAAVDEILGTMNFHNREDARRFIDLEEVPTKNGDPDKEWIREKATAIATEKAYLLKPVETPIPSWGGTSPPNPVSGPKPPVQELTPEQKGVKIVERGLVDPAGAVMDALGATPGVDKDSAMYKALNTPT